MCIVSEPHRLDRIRFYVGSGPDATALEITPSTVVVLIGPNNAGKSLTLREIEHWCIGQDEDRKVVESISVNFPTDFESAMALIRPFMDSPARDPILDTDQIEVRQPTFRPNQLVNREGLRERDIRKAVATGNELLLRRFLMKWHVIRLDGRTRFELTDKQTGGDLLSRPQNHLTALAQNDKARDRVRTLTAEAFGAHFVLSFLDTGNVHIRMSPRPPNDSEEELALSPRAQAFHRNATAIEEMSDGVKSFTGLVAAVQSLPHQVVLVDEPEAFLHPPLARRLGGALAALARDRDASLIVATHSAEFLLGCIESVAETSVVRLSYEAGVATARELPAEKFSTLARDPLLRSTDVLRALFHRAAVVAEADSDRVFYDEMNQRLLLTRRGVADCLFLNAQGKDTIHRLVGPLRRIGIPTAAIADLDIIKRGPAWSGLIEACGIPWERHNHLSAERVHFEQAFAALTAKPNGREMLKATGVDALASADRARADALLHELAFFGLFLVPKGELESWLPELAVTGHGNDWVVNLFGQIGATPDDPGYLKPSDDDVWAFIDRIAQWVSDPGRKGMA